MTVDTKEDNAMRKVIAIALLLMLGFSALAEDAPGNMLGFEMLARMGGRGNRMISPVSLGYALSMAAAGAEDDTLDELLEALNADDALQITALNEPLKEAGLRCANAAFLMSGLELKEAYEDALRDEFEAECFEPEDVDEINAWVDEQTDGMIDHLLNDLPADMRLMLVNAVAMDARWARKFDPDMTRKDVFHAPKKDVRVDFMRQTGNMEYGERDGVQFVKKAYATDGLAMWIALPPRGKLKKTLRALADAGLDYFMFDDEPRRVSLSLPKLDLSASCELKDMLRKAGIEQAFTEEAQFGGISNEPLMISDVLQKVRLQVDEDGTRAAAATAVIAANGMAVNQPKPVEMKVDRPFLLVIVEETTGTALFAAAIADPDA